MRRVLAIGLALTALASCTWPRTEVVHSGVILSILDPGTNGFGPTAPSDVLVLGYPSFAIHGGPVEVLAIEPLDDRGLTLLTARVSFYGCTRCRVRPEAGPLLPHGAWCTPSYPPAWQGTYPLEHQVLYPGDAPSVLFFYRPSRTGAVSAGGFRLVYRSGSVRKVVTVRGTMVTADVRARATPCRARGFL